MNEQLLFSVENHVATITINRPEAYNATSPEIKQGLKDAVDEINRRDDIWVVILTGTGKAFSAGGDIKAMKERIEADVSLEERLSWYEDGVADVVRKIKSVRQPIIAAVNGAAVGAGCSIAILCDIIISSDRAKFGIPFAKRGLILDWGANYYLPRFVGLPRAIELAATGRIFGAQEALEMGLVHKVVEHDSLMEYVRNYAQEICQSGPEAVRKSKELMTRSLTMDLDSSLKEEGLMQAYCFRSEEHKEGVYSFLEKRPADFSK